MITHSKYRLLAVGFAVALVVAGCGGGNGNGMDDLMMADDGDTMGPEEALVVAASNVPVLNEAGTGLATSGTVSVVVEREVIDIDGVEHESNTVSSFTIDIGQGRSGEIDPDNPTLYFPDGTLGVTSTQTTGSGENYLVLGEWQFSPSDETGTFEIGFFVDGGDPFQETNLTSLTGGAVYYAQAVVRASNSAGEVERLLAEVTLDADFGDGGTLGSITGSVQDYQRVVDEAYLEPAAGYPDLVLLSTSISDSEGGFFTGDTSGAVGDSQWSGTWGGQFYNNTPEYPNIPPTSVGGTFGAATEDGTKGLLGGFAAIITELLP